MTTAAPNATSPCAAWGLILTASAITMAARLPTGLSRSPLNTAIGPGVASISFTAGALAQRRRMTWLLALMHGSRAVIVAVYLPAPKFAWTFYVRAAALGFTWLAPVLAASLVNPPIREAQPHAAATATATAAAAGA
jgi:hypothetical protein